MATTKNWRAVAEQAERARIRAQLKLRYSTDSGWQVYTKLHGSDEFKWFYITSQDAEWYKVTFPEIRIVDYAESRKEEYHG